MWSGPTEVAEAVARLRAGGLVAFPTETVYGLGADAMNAAAVRRVFEVKGRPSTNPLIVHVTGPEMARAVAAEWPREAEQLAAAFWPGPLTLVLPRRRVLPDEVTAGGPTVAVRCPDHRLTLDLLEAFGGPLVGPSANASGRISPTTAAHVREAFTPEQVYVLDGGPCTGGIESTVVKLGDPVRVLREGLITPEAIARVLGRTPERGYSAATHMLESPGQLASHYAPATRTLLVDVSELASRLTQVPRGVVLSHLLVKVSPPHRLRRMPADARAYASTLYAAMREADRVGADCILIVRPDAAGTPEEQSVWNAVLDRLTRAATPGS
jgi:L-threonylcarbamoyladenylate synthase